MIIEVNKSVFEFKMDDCSYRALIYSTLAIGLQSNQKNPLEPMFFWITSIFLYSMMKWKTDELKCFQLLHKITNLQKYFRFTKIFAGIFLEKNVKLELSKYQGLS